jgi:hypothetical protein
MKLKTEEEIIKLPEDIDKECIEICNTLNRLPGTETFESCMGHGKHGFWIFFRCYDIDTISRLGRAVDKNYSDGNWEIVVDSTDTKPLGNFWLRSKKILQGEKLEKSLRELVENILYWFKDEFDSYYKNNGEK